MTTPTDGPANLLELLDQLQTRLERVPRYIVPIDVRRQLVARGVIGDDDPYVLGSDHLPANRAFQISSDALADVVGMIEHHGITLNGPGQARHDDPPTSQKAAAELKIGRGARRGLLYAHRRAEAGVTGSASYATLGMTDEEAAAAAGLSLRSEYATRCSELRRMGALEELPGVEREGASGQPRQASRITALGYRLLVQGDAG